MTPATAIPSLENDQAPRELAGGEGAERLVRLVNTVPLGDQLVDAQFAGQVETDHPREVVVDARAAVRRADQPALRANQQPRVDLDLLPRWGEAHDHAGAALRE